MQLVYGRGARVELRQLEYLVKIGHEGSASRAAEWLHLTQPALSRQIADLEREIGRPLFQRGPRGMRLTAAGAAVSAAAQQILSQVAQLSEVARVAESAGVPVRVSLPPGLPEEWFRARVPRYGFVLSLEDASTDHAMRLLDAGALDFAFTHARVPHGTSTLVLKQPLGAVVRRDSALSGRARLDIDDLDGLTIMAHSLGDIRATEDQLRSAVAAAGVKPTWVFRRFGQHSQLIADFAGADAALTTSASATVNYPDWQWIPINAELTVQTWLSHRESMPANLRAFRDAFTTHGSGSNAPG